MFTGNLAWAELLAGQPDLARRRLDDFIAAADPERTCLARPLAVRALVARADGDLERAEELAAAAVAVSPADAFGRLTVWTCLAVLAAVKADAGRPELGARLAGAAAAFVREAGLTRLPGRTISRRGCATKGRGCWPPPPAPRTPAGSRR
jgi:ATP/maltotriose-dependent transcriptional regulator MalT